MKSEDTPLILTKHFTLFNRKRFTYDENEKYLIQAGFIPHENCTLPLPLRAHVKSPKTVSRIDLLCPEEDIKCNIISKKLTPSADSLQQQQPKLSDLPIGVYDVSEITCRKSTYGRFLIHINYGGTTAIIISNKSLDGQIPKCGIIASTDNSSVAQLHILNKKRDHNRHGVLNAEITILLSQVSA